MLRQWDAGLLLKANQLKHIIKSCQPFDLWEHENNYLVVVKEGICTKEELLSLIWHLRISTRLLALNTIKIGKPKLEILL